MVETTATALKVKVRNGKKKGPPGPMLCTFPRGRPEMVHNLEFKVSNVRNKKRRIRVEARGGNVAYNGKNYGESSKSKNLNKYAIAVLDPETGELRMSEVDHMYEMEQRVTTVKNDSSLTPKTFDAGRGELINVFGSAKRIRAYSSAVKGRINIQKDNSLMGLDQALADDPVERNLSEQMASATDANAAANGEAPAAAHLPPHDIKAVDPDDAYPTNGLLSNENLSALNPKAANALKYPCSLVRLALARANTLQKKQKKMRIRMAMYLHYLLSFYVTSHRRSNKGQRIDDAPPSITEQLTSLFTEKGKKQSVTMANRTKLLCRICVVSLKASGFAVI
mmetsp:Transcript_3566/g.5629  ORF Transcript_3566/g.5629 Transcript_3566/m.5629 type:complete len:337 (+) Transcript_3566:218-1228(+)